MTHHISYYDGLNPHIVVGIRPIRCAKVSNKNPCQRTDQIHLEGWADGDNLYLRKRRNIQRTWWLMALIPTRSAGSLLHPGSTAHADPAVTSAPRVFSKHCDNEEMTAIFYIKPQQS